MMAMPRIRAVASPMRSMATLALTRYASTAVAVVPTYKEVKFVQEDMETVRREVPEFQFYHIGNDEVSENPYKGYSMREAIPLGNVPEPVFSKGEMKFSRLENGLRIASVDKQGLTSQLSLHVNAGVRHEALGEDGVAHLLEVMSWKSTGHLSHLRCIKTMEQLGATVECNAGREHTSYSVEVLRDYYPLVVPLIVGNVLFPRFLPWECNESYEQVKKLHGYFTNDAEASITEALHNTAWRNNTLGRSLKANERSLAHFNGDTMRNFMLRNHSPDNMVFVGVNVDHDELSRWLMRSFVEYNAITPTKRVLETPRYTGGEQRIDAPSTANCTLAVAFEAPGMNSPDHATSTVIRQILGGMDVTEVGGPGRGLKTKLSLLMKKNPELATVCSSYAATYSDTGLIGAYTCVRPSDAKKTLELFAAEFKSLTSVTEEELKRAKVQLKVGLQDTFESQGSLANDAAEQLLCTNKYSSPAQITAQIEAVTLAAVKTLAAKILASPLTIASHGDHSQVPHYDDACKMFK